MANCVDPSGRSMLYLAAALGDLDLCRYLHEHGADPTQVTKNSKWCDCTHSLGVRLQPELDGSTCLDAARDGGHTEANNCPFRGC